MEIRILYHKVVVNAAAFFNKKTLCIDPVVKVGDTIEAEGGIEAALGVTTKEPN